MSEVEFFDYGRTVSGKTRVWLVACRGKDLGWVNWYSNWRRYTFRPDEGTLYDPGCLREIADFCETKTKEHKEEKLETRNGRARCS